MTAYPYLSFNSLLKMDVETKRVHYKAMLKRSGMGSAEFLGLVERYVATYGEILAKADRGTKYTFAAQALAASASQAEQMVREEEAMYAEAKLEAELAAEDKAEYLAHLESETAEIAARTGTDPWRW